MRVMHSRAPVPAGRVAPNDSLMLRRKTQGNCGCSRARRWVILIWCNASSSPARYQCESRTLADRHMSMQSHIVPSGRPRTGNAAGRAVVATSAGLGILALLGMNPVVLALIALGVLGSLLILADPSIQPEPVPLPVQ